MSTRRTALAVAAAAWTALPAVLAGLALAPSRAGAADAPPMPLKVTVLSAAPKVDGELAEWGSDGWTAVPVKPALERKERGRYGLEESDDHNQTGSLTVQLKAGVHGSRLYLAVRWPDANEDKDDKGWEWRGTKYAPGRKRDDQFAVRFHLSGDFDRTMLGSREYRADVWLWSAARTNATGFAEDLHHAFTTKPTENAAEYSLPDGRTVYIRRLKDAGTPPYRALQPPRENQGEKLPAIELQKAAGSAGDVAAKGVWKAGFWSVEFARALNTGNADDVVFKPGQKLLGQIAVFNRGWDEHKSASEPILFEFPGAP